MGRKDKPYLSLYVQDFMTDEKLMECSAKATGVYIKIMCVLHKSETYGSILLRQKDKQTTNQIKNFSIKFAKHLPFDLETIMSAITELTDEGCLTIDGDSIYQKRMVNDFKLSVTRSETGKLGGNKTKEKSNNFAIAKVAANPDIDNDNEIDNELKKKKGEFLLNENFLVPEMLATYTKSNPTHPQSVEKDFKPLHSISIFIHDQLKLNGNHIENKSLIIKKWEQLCSAIAEDKFYKLKTLSVISNHIQEIYQIEQNGTESGISGNTSHKPSSKSPGRTIKFDRP